MALTSGCATNYVVEWKAKPHVAFDKKEQENVQVVGRPAYYALLPLSIPFDVLTSPIQFCILLAWPVAKTPILQGNYEMVTNAFNRADWGALRRLAKPGMKANEYIKLWESYERAGHPVRVGKLLSVEKNSQYYLDGKPCTTYSFELESKDGTPSVHRLQVVVREKGGKSTILDFWNFGW